MRIKILCVTENLTERCGANVSILLNLVRILDEYADIDILSQSNEYRPIDEKKLGIFNRYIVFESTENAQLLELQKKYNWGNLSKLKKIIILFLHPYGFVYLCDAKFFGYKITEKQYKHHIEHACKNEEYDIIIGVCEPYYIAKAIAKTNAHQIKTIIQLDPYTWNKELPKVLMGMRKYVEKRVLKRIDFLFAVSFVYDELVRKKMICKKKTISFQLPLIIAADCDDTQTGFFEEKENIDFVFIGQFYDRIRNPKYLLELFCQLPLNYVLHIYGGGSESILKQYENRLGKRLIRHGWVSAECARQQMYLADFLININNSITNQMPSKLFEYIGTGRPIINFCKVVNCPSIQCVSNYENVLTIVEQDPVSDSQVSSFCNFVDSHRGRIEPCSSILTHFQKYTDQYVSKQIWNVLLNLKKMKDSEK